MEAAANIPQIAKMLAEPARAAMLWTLIDGSTRPAGELAFAANVSAQSASAHLAQLVASGLLVWQAHGRHRYFRIAGPDAAHLIESLASFAASIQARTPRQPALARAMPSQFLQARTCYDHLAGDVAVRLLQAMQELGWLLSRGPEFELTAQGRAGFGALGIDPPEQPRRVFARCCVDLTQRRPHLAGVLGAALLDHCVRELWILRTPRSRLVCITPKGHAAFQQWLGVAT